MIGFKKGLISADEAVGALGDAQRQISIFLQGNSDAAEAMKIIGEIIFAINKSRA